MSISFRLNGKPAAGIAIYQTPEANSLQVGKEIKQTMAQLSKRFPEGLRYTVPYDTTTFVSDSINEVYKTLYQAGILVRLDEFTSPREGEEIMEVMCRYRTLGCATSTGAVISEAATVEEILEEVLAARKSERENRAIDNVSETAMEIKKREGYF